MGWRLGWSRSGWYLADPEWYGDADVDFDEEVALVGGFEIAIGYDIIFTFSLDFFVASLDAKASGATRITDSQIDLDGIAFQFGMRGTF